MDVKLLLNKATLKISEKAPVILLTVGVVGVVAGTVMAVKATKNSKDIDDELKEDLESLELTKEDELLKLAENEGNEVTELLSIKDIDNNDAEHFTIEDYNWIKNKIVFNVVKRYTILYWKPAIIETASIVCIIAGFKIIAKRYAALAVAYAGLDKSFREYRKRIQKEIGSERENELYYGYKKEIVKIPIFASGDIFSKADAINAIKETNCDGVIIARGSLGRLWIFKELLD